MRPLPFACRKLPQLGLAAWAGALLWASLDADAWYKEFPDDDHGAYYSSAQANSGNGAGFFGGTNIKGHLVKATYQ